MTLLPLSYIRPIALSTLALAICVSLCGCGDDAPKTHPVSGKVILSDGEIQSLVDAEAGVELQLESDPSIRSYGKIASDGSFDIQMSHNGRTFLGAVEGTHLVRIVLSEMPEQAEAENYLDDDGKPIKSKGKARTKAKNQNPKVKADAPVVLPVNERFLKFNTSKITYTVPGGSGLEMKVSKK